METTQERKNAEFSWLGFLVKVGLMMVAIDLLTDCGMPWWAARILLVLFSRGATP